MAHPPEGLAVSDKPKRKHIPPPAKPPTKPFDPNQQFWPDIEPSTECLIGKVSVAWAKLEASLHDLIWELAGLSLEDGRAITGKQDAVHLIVMLNVLGNRHIPDNLLMPDGSTFLHKFLDVLDYIEHRRRERNFILHGSWGQLDGIPIASSLREKSQNESEFAAETFPHPRLNAIARNIDQCKRFVVRTREIVVALREKRQPPRPEDLDTRPRDQCG